MTGRVPCAGAIIFDDRRRLLVIRRAHEPSAELWSIPGGRCLPGEDPAAACVREVREETGLDIEVIQLVGQVELSAPAGQTYIVDDFECAMIGGELAAGDDATDVRFVTRAELHALACSPGLVGQLAEWGLSPR